MTEVGKIVRIHTGALCDCKEAGCHRHNRCDKCGATFTMKNYANPGDDLTGECPFCQATAKTNEDPRKTGLKNGLRQLTAKQLQRVIDYQDEMVLDTYNYEGGKFCPLAIGAGLDLVITNPTHESVFELLDNLGYKVYNTRGIKGEFYTTNRKEDLMIAAKEVLQEKLDGKGK